MRLSRLRIILLTLLLATIALWITNQQTQSSSTTETSMSQPLPYSWHAVDTTIWKIVPNEQDKHTVIHAEKIYYKDKLKKSEFTYPSVQIIEKESITNLSSLKGESTNDEIITFNDKVIITQTSMTKTSEGSPNNTTLSTQSLSYNTQTNHAYTDAKVFIKQYNGETSGTGLKADLTNSEFELFSDVKGTYDINDTQPKNLYSLQPSKTEGQ